MLTDIGLCVAAPPVQTIELGHDIERQSRGGVLSNLRRLRPYVRCRPDRTEKSRNDSQRSTGASAVTQRYFSEGNGVRMMNDYEGGNRIRTQTELLTYFIALLAMMGIAGIGWMLSMGFLRRRGR